MKILLINHYAGNPAMGMEFRPYYFAKKWQKMGHEVLLVGGTYSHLRKQQPLQEGFEQLDGVDYYWVPTNRYAGNGAKRVLSMLGFVGKLFIRHRRICRHFIPDIVIASSTYPLDNYAASWIARRYGARYIYEIHDLWPLSPMELGGMSKYHPFIMMMQWAENYAYRHCDAVVSMLPKADQHCIAHGLAKEKFHYVPNGIVVEDWSDPLPVPAEHQRIIDDLKRQSRFLIGFVGAHGVANALHDVIAAAHELNQEQISLVLVGTGQEKEKLIRFAQESHAENVHFLAPVDKRVIPSLLPLFDCLYVGLQSQSLFRFGISPNKIFDYMMAKRPIVQAIDAGNNLVEEADCGLYAQPENIESIKSSLLAIKNMPAARREQMGENGYRFVMKHHNYDVLSERFIQIMKSLQNG